jgi:hypothetical protein
VLAGADPKPYAAAGFAALDRYLELFPEQAKAHRLRGEVHLELARAERRDGRSGGESVGAALRELIEAMRLQPSQERRVLPSLAALRALQLEAAGGGPAARRHLAAALDVARRIEELSGDDADSHLAAARLRRLEARLSDVAARRQEAAQEARALVARALAINPLLEAEARELLAGAGE